MIDTYKTYPFWRTRLEDVDAALSSMKRGRASVLTKSAGGRDIHVVTYGEKVDYGRRANYNSACGGRDVRCYADRDGTRPTLMLIGATHGQETEGVAGILNLISLLETGRDLAGREQPALLDAFEQSDCRLIIIPVYNVDGRARCVPDSMIGEPPESLRYHGQGTWKDGSLCGWPDCKKIHPIKEAAGFLGAYYNDDGVNLMHDNFFAPMAAETAALLKLADEEAPECIVGLHGGSNSTNELLQPSYTTLENRWAVHRLAEAIAALQTAHGLKSNIHPVREKAEGTPPPSFNLTSALHHVCGAVSSTYESNEGLLAPNAFTAREIVDHHYCLFEAMFRLGWRE